MLFESRTTLGLMIAGLLAANLMAAPDKPTVKSIGDQVICQCGCTQTVTSCNHFECATRAEMNSITDREIQAGKDETTILQDFVKRYGVQVLASPPAAGFGLTIWVLPGVGLVVGLVLVAFIVKRWRKRPPEATLSPAAPIDPKVLEAVEEEMKKVAG